MTNTESNAVVKSKPKSKRKRRRIQEDKSEEDEIIFKLTTDVNVVEVCHERMMVNMKYRK